MAADFTIKRNDTYPPMAATLRDKNGPIDLTTATAVKFLWKPMRSADPAETVNCTIVSPSTGQVTAAVGTLADAAGRYLGEFEIDWGSGNKQTVPNAGHLVIQVDEDLG